MDSTNNAVWGSELDAIVEYAINNSLGLIMCIDSNCHSTLFGPDTNNRGLKLEEALAVNDIKVENIGHAPTFMAEMPGFLLISPYQRV